MNEDRHCGERLLLNEKNKRVMKRRSVKVKVVKSMGHETI